MNNRVETKNNFIYMIYFLIGIIFFLIILLLVSLLTNKVLLEKKEKSFIINSNGSVFSMQEVISGHRSRAEIKEFSRQITELLYSYSYRDFEEEVVKRGESRINRALALMDSKLRNDIKKSFLEEQIPSNFLGNKLIMELKIKKIEILRTSNPFKVQVSFENWYKRNPTAKENVKVSYILNTVKRDENKWLGAYGMEVIGYE